MDTNAHSDYASEPQVCGAYQIKSQTIVALDGLSYRYDVRTGTVYVPGHMACSDNKLTYKVYVIKDPYIPGFLLREWDTSLKEPLKGGDTIFCSYRDDLFKRLYEFHQTGKTDLENFNIDINNTELLMDANPWLR